MNSLSQTQLLPIDVVRFRKKASPSLKRLLSIKRPPFVCQNLLDHLRRKIY